MTVRATWNDTVIAESDRTILVEGNHYFPPDDVAAGFLVPSATTTRCAWKGEARYHDVTADGATSSDGAWYYPDPLPAAEPVRGYLAFWHGVEVTGDNPGAPEIRPPSR